MYPGRGLIGGKDLTAAAWRAAQWLGVGDAFCVSRTSF